MFVNPPLILKTKDLANMLRPKVPVSNYINGSENSAREDTFM